MVMGAKTSTADVRRMLCTTDGGCADLVAAGFVAIPTAKRYPTGCLGEPNHWIVDKAQLRRLLRHHHATSVDDLPSSLLSRVAYQIDHLDPSQYYGTRDALNTGDVMSNYALTPRWLNGLAQWKNGFCSAKIAYIGFVGYQLFRLFRVATSRGPEVANRVNVALDQLHRKGTAPSNVVDSAFTAIGELHGSESLKRKLNSALVSFVGNSVIPSSDRERRYHAKMDQRKRTLVEAELEAPRPTADDVHMGAVVEDVVDTDDSSHGGCGSGMDSADAMPHTVTVSFSASAWERLDGRITAPRENRAAIKLTTTIDGIEVDDVTLGKRVFNTHSAASYVLYLEKSDGHGNFSRVSNESPHMLQLREGKSANDFAGPLSRSELFSMRWTNKTAKKHGPVRVCIGFYPQHPVQGEPQARYKLAQKMGVARSQDLCLVSESKLRYNGIKNIIVTATPTSRIEEVTEPDA
jgi:hypothetical protein